MGRQLASKIELLGIKVDGTKIEEADIEIDDEIVSFSNNPDKEKRLEEFPVEISNIKKVNLDISAMLAYVSSVCNGSADLYELPEGVLAQQAAWERLRPQKPVLETFFKGMHLLEINDLIVEAFLLLVPLIEIIIPRERIILLPNR